MNREERLWQEIALMKRQLAALRNETGLALRQANKMGRISVAWYQTNAGQTISNSTKTIVNFEDLKIDTHGCVTAGTAWVWEAPFDGAVLLMSYVLFNSTTAWGANEGATLYAYNNGNEQQYLGLRFDGNYSPGSACFAPVGGNLGFNVARGDQVDVRVSQTSGGDLSLFNNASFNFVSIFCFPTAI